MFITNDIYYVGVNDHQVDLFEGQYSVANGMAYNSYVIIDEKIAVLDSVDAHFRDEWLQNLETVLAGRLPSYLIVQHMEPDHSANIAAFAERYPKAIIVSSAKAFNMMQGYFGTDFAERRGIVAEGSTLNLGRHELLFVTAPMVHWPEVIFTYDKTAKVLFSADAFGKFGALDAEEEWLDEARRYFIGIVGKFGPQVQAVLKKAAGLDINCICALHGPVLKENLAYYLRYYDLWSSYTPEEAGIVIAYTSVYGHTRAAVELLMEELKKLTTAPVVAYDLARADQAAAVAGAFRYDRLVLATTTYNAGIFPSMHFFLSQLTEHNFQNRRVAFLENGSWAPCAAKIMRGLLEKSKNLRFSATTVQIKAALSAESRAQIKKLAQELSQEEA